jgi:hypothetical protein
MQRRQSSQAAGDIGAERGDHQTCLERVSGFEDFVYKRLGQTD